MPRIPGVSRRAFLSAGVAGLLLPWAGPSRADLPATIAHIKPSVVVVGRYKATDNPRFQPRGTGFAVGDGRYVVTNAHVVTQADGPDPMASLMVRVGGPGSAGELRPVRLLESDLAHDLALLRLEGAPLPPLVLAEASSVREGMSIAFTGFPMGGVLGFSPVTHRGIISSITAAALPAPTSQQLDPRAIRRLMQGPSEIYQLDAVAYPGNSGGPVFDETTGAVVGVISMVAVKGTRESALTHPTGITYAVPVRYVRQLLDRAISPPR
jgi:serine protease Do